MSSRTTTTQTVVDARCFRYLTDGTRLFRRADELGTHGESIWLEDCRTLETHLVGAETLFALRGVPTFGDR